LQVLYEFFQSLVSAIKIISSTFSIVQSKVVMNFSFIYWILWKRSRNQPLFNFGESQNSGIFSYHCKDDEYQKTLVWEQGIKGMDSLRIGSSKLCVSQILVLHKTHLGGLWKMLFLIHPRYPDLDLRQGQLHLENSL
jgi:hypothetical protein